MAIRPRVVNGSQGHTDTNMTLSDESLDHFIKIYKADSGERLSRDDARVIAGRLLSSARLITQPQRVEGIPQPQSGPAAP